MISTDTSQLHQRHIVLHELGHMLFEHRGGLWRDGDLARSFAPDLELGLIERMLGRPSSAGYGGYARDGSGYAGYGGGYAGYGGGYAGYGGGYADSEEDEAETFADLVAGRTHQWPGLPPLAQQCALRRLRPLWSMLTSAMPLLERRRLVRDDAGYRLYRRVIEIRDGLVTLYPYRDRGVELRAMMEALHAGLAGTAARARAEAHAIAAALTAMSRPAPERPETPAMPAGDAARSIKDEVIWLSQVSRAMISVQRR